LKQFRTLFSICPYRKLEDLIEKDPLVQDFENCKRVVENATLNEALSILVQRQSSHDSNEDVSKESSPSIPLHLQQKIDSPVVLAPLAPPIKLKICLGQGQERVTVIKRQSESDKGQSSADNKSGLSKTKVRVLKMIKFNVSNIRKVI
jgi:hypothetical protein